MPIRIRNVKTYAKSKWGAFKAWSVCQIFKVGFSKIVPYSLKLFTVFVNNSISDVVKGAISASSSSSAKYFSTRKMYCSIQNKGLSYIRLFRKHHGRSILNYTDFSSWKLNNINKLE